MHIRPASLALMFDAAVGSVVPQSAAECPSCLAPLEAIPEWQCRLIPQSAEERWKLSLSKAARIFIPFSVPVNTRVGSWVIRHWQYRRGRHARTSITTNWVCFTLQFDTEELYLKKPLNKMDNLLRQS